MKEIERLSNESKSINEKLNMAEQKNSKPFTCYASAILYLLHGKLQHKMTEIVLFLVELAKLLYQIKLNVL